MTNSTTGRRRDRLTVAGSLAAVLSVGIAMGVASPAYAAVDVNTLRTASTAAIADAIIGDGVTLVTAAFTGDPVQLGSYTGLDIGESSLNSGIALSTGSLIAADPTADSDVDFTDSSLAGPNTKLTTTGDLGGLGYAPLTALAGVTTYDAAVLELTIVPAGNDLTLRFAFGSEEYAEWSEQDYGDAFGVWVDGELCSLTPDRLPVGTATVNGTANAALYTANFSGRDASTAYDTEMNGFTAAIECTADVVAGSESSLVIAIADTRDGQLDSTAVIGAQSLVSTPLPSTSPSPSAPPASPAAAGPIDPGTGAPNGTGVLDNTGSNPTLLLSIAVMLLIAGAVAVTAVARSRQRAAVIAEGAGGDSPLE